MSDKHVLVTGGAGFIGTNVADRLASDGEEVCILDSLMREGVERNWEWLKRKHGDRVMLLKQDVRDRTLENTVRQAKVIFHFAGQTAVTTSYIDPREDLSVNLLGTFNVLEAVRQANPGCPVIFASTNKVYGKMSDVQFEQGTGTNRKYTPVDPSIAEHGFNESRPLEFYSPYGCSKGSADQYVLDYARDYGLKTAVMRMSCIYGPHQHGTTDQGWLAHFIRLALARQPIDIFGDGHQVRDVLYVEDAVEAYIRAWKQIDTISGKAFNLGGGPENAISLLELIGYVEAMLDRPITLNFGDWRPGDQRYYVSDVSELRKRLGQWDFVNWRTGVGLLLRWLRDEDKRSRAA